MTLRLYLATLTQSFLGRETSAPAPVSTASLDAQVVARYPELSFACNLTAKDSTSTSFYKREREADTLKATCSVNTFFRGSRGRRINACHPTPLPDNHRLTPTIQDINVLHGSEPNYTSTTLHLVMAQRSNSDTQHRSSHHGPAQHRLPSRYTATQQPAHTTACLPSSIPLTQPTTLPPSQGC
ncbi:hypothetical protein GWK47_042265 [Chionoecetes opilio]|uniref:Uncharacterized protein n=1 Tax=Chionoecetes opilio TaxID=41210 RepID=A0A8J4YBK2_CHIOP|nr:hypothetical protein GWK47_042265 [Chionoecetes opilio]